MIILKQTTDLQTVKFIATRFNSGEKLFLTNETTKKTVELDIYVYPEAYYHIFQCTFELEENTFYNMVIEDCCGNVQHRERIFVTNQEIDSYKVSNSNNVIYPETQKIIYNE
jgi:hypothetical protein